MTALPPLALYVHIPWCVKKCPYCDFNSHRAAGALPVDAYVAALLADLKRDAAMAEGRRIDSVFFGGGTPSLFPPEAIARILDGADRLLPFAADAEVTLEANPGTIEHGRFDGYRAAGVNRVSFGVQSFDDAALRRIGRIHGGEEARRAVAEARAGGIDNVNIDLMYALPGQTVDAAIADLDAALALAPTHLSHYQLTIEPNTEFAKRPPMLPDDDEAAEIEEAATRALKAAGFGRYETSAYARPGRRCHHNLAYWTFADYLGIGAGAHGKLSRGDGAIVRTTKLKVPQNYLARAASGDAFGSEEPVEPAQLPFEFMLNALRLVDGFDASLYPARTGLDPATIEGPLALAVERGWLAREGNHVAPTALGRRFLNDVIQLFMP
jgi:oxygen-independent coproporphyrinogen-3 oxidase